MIEAIFLFFTNAAFFGQVCSAGLVIALCAAFIIGLANSSEFK